MIDISYKIEFFDNWHTGSGLSAGADLDDLVIKDTDKLPFVPGKTIKGLVRQALEDILAFKGDVDDKKMKIEETFGLLKEEPVLKDVANKSDVDEIETEINRLVRGTVFFTNATISDELSNKIKNSDLQKYLYSRLASTAIGEDGIAKEHSLRQMEVTIPCVLYGKIYGIDSHLKENMIDALSFIKRLGVNRNRGLGRCQFSVTKIEEGKS